MKVCNGLEPKKCSNSQNFSVYLKIFALFAVDQQNYYTFLFLYEFDCYSRCAVK